MQPSLGGQHWDTDLTISSCEFSSGKLPSASMVAFQKAILIRLIRCSGSVVWLSISTAPPALDSCIVDKAIWAYMANFFSCRLCCRNHLFCAIPMTIAILSFTTQYNYVTGTRTSTLPLSTVRKWKLSH